LQWLQVRVVGGGVVAGYKLQVTGLQGFRVAGLQGVTVSQCAEKLATSLRRMPVFFEHPRNGKEIKDFCHFGSRKCE